MNFFSTSLLLVMIISIILHLNLMKKKKEFHSVLILSIKEKITFENNKMKKRLVSNNENQEKSIKFKLSIIKQQIELLTAISSQKEF